MKTYTLHEVEAYALGYYDGRSGEGNEALPEDFNDSECHAYRIGYERGVGDFCRYELGELDD